MKKLFWLFFLAIVAAVGWLTWATLTPAQPAEKTVLLLRPGYSSRRIASELKNAVVIESKAAFLFWHLTHRGRSLKAGEYVFEKPANIADIHDRLARGDVYFLKKSNTRIPILIIQTKLKPG